MKVSGCAGLVDHSLDTPKLVSKLCYSEGSTGSKT